MEGGAVPQDISGGGEGGEAGSQGQGGGACQLLHDCQEVAEVLQTDHVCVLGNPPQRLKQQGEPRRSCGFREGRACPTPPRPFPIRPARRIHW